MQYRKLGDTGIKLSAIGFGCMRLPISNYLAVPLIRRAVELGINYFENSAVYCHNRGEAQCGLALEGLRDKVYVSTKSQVLRKGDHIIEFGAVADRDSTGEDFRYTLKESLHKLGTNRVDFYNFHAFSLNKLPIAMAEGGPLDVLKEAKEDGVVGHIGFTTHDTTENIIKIIDTGEFETVTVYHNLLRTRRTDGGGGGRYESVLPAIEHARKKGLGVIIMGPLGGGILGAPIEELKKIIPDTKSTVELAFRYLLSIPGVTTPISGMQRISDVEENAKIASEFKPLSESEMTKIDKVVDKYSALMGQSFCTGCGYCQPCPHSVSIPGIFRLTNFYKVYGIKDWAIQQYKALQSGLASPSGAILRSAEYCIQCGECEKKCPQKINIRDELKKAHALLTSL